MDPPRSVLYDTNRFPMRHPPALVRRSLSLSQKQDHLNQSQRGTKVPGLVYKEKRGGGQKQSNNNKNTLTRHQKRIKQQRTLHQRPQTRGMGGSFSARTRFKAIPLPHGPLSSLPRNATSGRGVRLQPICKERFMVVPPTDIHEQQEDGMMDPNPFHESNNMLGVTLEFGAIGTQQVDFNDSRELEDPLRVETLTVTDVSHKPNYIMLGNKAMAHNRKQMEEEEIIRLQNLGLEPAPELYFGRGMNNQPKSVRLRHLRNRPIPDTSMLEIPQAQEEEEKPPHEHEQEAKPEEDDGAEEVMEENKDEQQQEPDTKTEDKTEPQEPQPQGWEGTVMDSNAPTADATTENNDEKEVEQNEEKESTELSNNVETTTEVVTDNAEPPADSSIESAKGAEVEQEQSKEEVEVTLVNESTDKDAETSSTQE
eukprot:m.342813 g.342813  ORF g.342813 m.342813 type:complete len:424 (-) comp21857_c0_seq1:118-1389(-)